MNEDWRYDEFRQLAVDFDDPEQVRLFEAKHPSDPVTARKTLEGIGVGEGTVLLDMGCATGWFTVEAARLGAVAHGVDTSRTMVEFARAKAKESGVDAVFHQAGILSYEHAGPAPDVVVTRFVLHHMPDFWKSIAIGRMAKLLRPGGYLYYRDMTYSFDPRDYESTIARWMVESPKRCGYSKAEMFGHLRDEYTTYAWIVEGMLERAGFEIVRTELTPDAMQAEYLCRVRP
jgi:putative AdoMet-dependent methyltransferase